jgi:hypothetical protein
MCSQNEKISIEYDEYLNQFWEDRPRWEVILSNDLKVYQDDGRPGTTISAWERLRNYCINNNLFLSSMKIAFRDNVKSLPEGKTGYYFRKMSKCYFGSGKTKENFIIGYEEFGVIKAKIFAVPELILDFEEDRIVDLEDLSLISQKVVKKNLLVK